MYWIIENLLIPNALFSLPKKSCKLSKTYFPLKGGFRHILTGGLDGRNIKKGGGDKRSVYFKLILPGWEISPNVPPCNRHRFFQENRKKFRKKWNIQLNKNSSKSSVFEVNSEIECKSFPFSQEYSTVQQRDSQLEHWDIEQ